MEEKKIAAIREALRRTKSKIQKLHTKLLDKKNCLAAKLLAAFRSAGTVVYQDEQIAKWQKTGFGRSIQQSVLSKFRSLLKQQPQTVVLDKFIPTTKLCLDCGKILKFKAIQPDIRGWARRAARNAGWGWQFIERRAAFLRGRICSVAASLVA